MKTSEQTSIKRYRVTLGNTDSRPGHRIDCAQVQVRIYVDATSVDEAVELAREAFKEGRRFTPPLFGRPKGRIAVIVEVAPERLRAVDVVEIKGGTNR